PRFLAALRGAPPPFAAPAADEFDALEQHGLIPLLHHLGVEALRDAARDAAVVEPLRLRDLRAVLDALGDVPLLVTKGTALAYDVYPAPELRPRADVDLLIRERDLARVRETLLADGFIERLTSGDELGIRQASFSRVDAFGAEHLYDVHWDVTNMAVFRDALRFDELHARSIALPRIHERARGLAHVDALLLACIHRVAHHHDSERLIWLYDIHLLRERMSRDDHARFWQLARERRVVAVCERSIELADALLANAPHDRALEHLEAIPRDEATRIFLDGDIARGELFAAELKALGPRERMQRLWQLAFPPRAFIRAQFPRHGPAMLPWLYAWRVVRGLARLFRRVA
ncbi:MAG TPA: nucleotidyltransferase family protein, partial [Thermoanaerobaculia bacterium]